MRRNVGRHRLALNADVRTKVGTGGVNRSAGQHNWRERAVRATIDDEFDLLGEQLPIFCDGRLVSGERRMALGRRDHVLRAIIDDLDGLARFPRQQRCVSGNHRRIFFFAAEAAASLSLNHTNLFFRQSEQLD